MNNWQQEIIRDRMDRIKSINFCVSNESGGNEGLSSTSSYTSGIDLKKSLESYLFKVKEEAKNAVFKSEWVLRQEDFKQEINSINAILSKIDTNKEYRMPDSILKKLK